MIEQLREHFNNATNEQLHHGMHWYYKAHRICKRIALHTKTPLYKVVGVMSALSPRNKWERNISDTVDLIRRGKRAKVATYNANKYKALAILKADYPEEVETLLNGTKIVSFYNNILRPSQTEHVTIDVWAMRSVNFTGNLSSKGAYRGIQEAYIEVANEVGIKPHEMQAIIWGVVRDVSQ